MDSIPQHSQIDAKLHAFGAWAELHTLIPILILIQILFLLEERQKTTKKNKNTHNLVRTNNKYNIEFNKFIFKQQQQQKQMIFGCMCFHKR